MVNKISRENIVMLDYTQESQNLHLHHKFFCNFDGTELAEIRYNFHPKKPFAVMSDWSFLKSKQFKKYDEALEYIHNCWIGEIIETWDWDEIRAGYPKEYE